MHDVIVVGAGPAGCYTAYLLAKQGHEVLLLEEHAAPGEQVLCSGIIGIEAFEEMPLPRETVQSRLQDALFVSPGNKEFHYQPDADLAYIVSRHAFDAALARMALAAGAGMMVNAHAERITVDDEGVKLNILKEKEPVVLEARLCVLATGFGTGLLSRAGFEEPLPVVQGAQVELEMADLSESEIYLGREVAPGGFAWAVPLGNRRARVGITTDHRAPSYLQKLLQHPKLRDRLAGSSFRIQSCPIPIGTRANCVLDRLMVVGEAAGQVKTTTNGGIYYGMLCAGIASEAANEALRADDLRRERLLPYDQRWRDRLESELRLGLTLRDFFTRLSDRQIDILFDLTRIDGIVYLIRKMARFDWHGPLIQAVLGQGFFRTILHSALGRPSLPTVHDVQS
jgi:geranylgeranyl reductase family protein